MVYGETGRYLLDMSIKCRIISFSSKLLDDNENKLSSNIYKLSYFNYTVNNFDFKWIRNVENILNTCGFSNMFLFQNGNFRNWLVSSIKLRLIDQFKQSWYSNLQNSP